jgi:Co/Zn/Cd efflux system component
VNDYDHQHPGVRRAVFVVLLANLTYFFVEFTFAVRAQSVALFADSIDFLEDSALNLLILLSLTQTLRIRRRVSRILALMMLIPAAGGAWLVVSKILNPQAPEALTVTLVGIGALVVNVFCALLMARYRRSRSGLLLAAFFSARNDAVANSAIIVGGVVTLVWVSAIPDIVVGLAIMALNADSAWKIWNAADSEPFGAKT